MLDIVRLGMCAGMVYVYVLHPFLSIWYTYLARSHARTYTFMYDDTILPHMVGGGSNEWCLGHPSSSPLSICNGPCGTAGGGAVGHGQGVSEPYMLHYAAWLCVYCVGVWE